MGKLEDQILDAEIDIKTLNSNCVSKSTTSLYDTFKSVLGKINKSTADGTEDQLTLLLVQKELQISHIEDIDRKIIELNHDRKESLQIIASIEKEEINIKKTKESLKAKSERLSNLQAIAEEKENVKETSIKFVSQPLPKNKRRPLKSETRIKRPSRNITPVLQNYYKPLSLINEYQLPGLSLKSIDFDIPFGSMFFLSKESPHSIGMCDINGAVDIMNTKSKEHDSDGNENSEDLATQIGNEDITHFSGSQATINCFKYHDNTLFAGSNDAKVYIYSKYNNAEEEAANNFAPIATLDSHTNEVTCIDYEGDVLVSGAQDRTVRQWDLNKECCVNVIDLNMIVQGPISNSSRIFSGSMTPSATSWMSTSTGFRSRSDSIISRSGSVFDFNAIMNGPSTNADHDIDTIYSPYISSGLESSIGNDAEFASSKNSYYSQLPFYVSKIQVFDAALATGTSDGIVRLWDIRSKNVMRQLNSSASSQNNFSSICDMKFDSHQIIASNYNGEVIIWDLRMGKILNLLKVGDEVCNGSEINFEMNRNYIVANNSFDGTVHLYDRIKQTFVKWDEKNEDTFSSNVTSIRFKSGYLLEGYNDGIVKSWRI